MKKTNQRLLIVGVIAVLAVVLTVTVLIALKHDPKPVADTDPKSSASPEKQNETFETVSSQVTEHPDTTKTDMETAPAVAVDANSDSGKEKIPDDRTSAEQTDMSARSGDGTGIPGSQADFRSDDTIDNSERSAVSEPESREPEPIVPAEDPADIEFPITVPPPSGAEDTAMTNEGTSSSRTPVVINPVRPESGASDTRREDTPSSCDTANAETQLPILPIEGEDDVIILPEG